MNQHYNTEKSLTLPVHYLNGSDCQFVNHTQHWYNKQSINHKHLCMLVKVMRQAALTPKTQYNHLFNYIQLLFFPAKLIIQLTCVVDSRNVKGDESEAAIGREADGHMISQKLSQRQRNRKTENLQDSVVVRGGRGW